MTRERFEVPEGCERGLLPRSQPIGTFYPCASIARIPPLALADWVPQKPLRWLEYDEVVGWANLWDVYQNGHGACTCCGLDHLITFTRARAGDKPVKLDWFKFYKTLNPRLRGGVALDDAMNEAMTNGYPLADGSGVVKITEAYDAATKEELGAAVQRGFGAIFGHDEHCECMLSLQLAKSASDQTKLSAWEAEARNSWARTWGREGYHQFPLAEVELSTYGCGIVCATELILK